MPAIYLLTFFSDHSPPKNSHKTYAQDPTRNAEDRIKAIGKKYKLKTPPKRSHPAKD